MTGRVTSVLRANETEFREDVLRKLHIAHPETRILFQPNLEYAHQKLVLALGYFLDNELDEDLVATLARDHRAFGLTPEVAETGVDIITECLLPLCGELPYFEVRRTESKLEDIKKIMSDTLRNTPPPVVGTVVDVQRRARRITVVRLECPSQVHYLPGQYLSVSSQLIQGMWPHLCPAMPSNRDGFIEFHLNDSPELQGLAMSKPGDEWTFGPAHGNLQITGDKNVTMIANGTGLAPLRAMLLDLADKGTDLLVHLFFSAEFPGELYELAGLSQLSMSCPWLIVTPVVEKAQDDWWVGATDYSKALDGSSPVQAFRTADAVTSSGGWLGREVLISGPQQWADDTIDTLMDRGIPLEDIQAIIK